MAVLAIENASFSYDGKRDIFTDLNYSITTNQVFCILGPNGIGKSTLLRSMMNLYPLRKGRILLDEKDIRQYPPQELAKKISLIPQNYTFSFPYKVLDIVLMGRTPHLNGMARPSDEDYEKAVAAIEELGLGDLIYRPCTGLSGGQMQLVMLAQAIAQEAEFLMMDEPTSHLDYGKQMQTLEIVADMRRRHFGVIMTTHDPSHAFLVGDKVAIMNGGGFAAVGTPDEVITEESLRMLYELDVRILTVDGGAARKVCVPMRREEKH